MTAYPISEIERMKRAVEILSKNHHIEILKIIKQFQDVKLNENKSGVYINLTFLSKSVLDKINEYLEHISNQEQMLEPAEKEKTLIKSHFDTVTNDTDIIINDAEKQDKDIALNRYSYIC